jgi:ABC-2 type transport system ATP-binding protein
MCAGERAHSLATVPSCIEVAGLTKRYGRTLAVDDLSFTVEPGRVTGFVGPNGAGKSTTMRMILGLDAADRGEAHIGGQRYADLRDPLRSVGSLLDAGALHPERRAHDHLLWMAQANGLPASRVAEVLRIVGLRSVARQRVRGYSLGMRQRLGIASALLGDPPVLLFDEPVNGLDPEGVAWIRGLLRSLAAEGRTVLVSSHLMAEMALTADHLVVLGRGRLIAQASLQDFVRRAGIDRVTVRSPEHDSLAALLRQHGATIDATDADELVVSGIDRAIVGRTAARHGIELHELATRQASLEEAFMHLTSDATDYRTRPLDA